MNDKISIRFYSNRPVRAIWDELVSDTNQLKLPSVG